MAEPMTLVKGTLDALVLRALTWDTMHGFEITAWIEDRTHGALGIDDSALYQALHRMEERGWLVTEWGVTENNRRARYYSLTRAGPAHLAAETTRWVRYAQIVTAVLTASPRGT